MYPISHYVNDREEMINQVFKVIQGKKLRSMLPPFLAEMDVDEVKALCLEQVGFFGGGTDSNSSDWLFSSDIGIVLICTLFQSQS